MMKGAEELTGWMKKNNKGTGMNATWWALNPRQSNDWRSGVIKNMTRDYIKFAATAILETNRTKTYREQLLQASGSSRFLRVTFQKAWKPLRVDERYVYADGIVVKDDGTMDGGGAAKPVDVKRVLGERKRKQKEEENRKKFVSFIQKIEMLPGSCAKPDTKLLSDDMRDALDRLCEVSVV